MEMNKWIGSKVKQVWNVAMLWCTIFWGVCHKHNSLPLGPIQISSPSTKELHDLGDKDAQLVECSVLGK